MLTFKQAQDLVLERFSDGRRTACKEWLNYVLGQVWAMEPWVFKQATALVTVTAGSQAVSNLPADLGVIHELQNANGDPLRYRDWHDFHRYHYAETQAAGPFEWTVIGTGPLAQVLVAKSAETSSGYQVLYERERGYYPSTTVTAETVLPAATIQVASTAAAPSSGTVLIAGRPVTYTGKTALTLTGCTGGTGTFENGETVVFASAPQAGELANDTDVPLLPPETHQILVHAAQAIGQASENDYSLYLSDDRVQQGLATMRMRYLIQQADETIQWGSYEDAHALTGWW